MAALTKREVSYIGLAFALTLGIVALLYDTFFSIGTDGVIYALLAQSIAKAGSLSLYGVAHTVFSPLQPITTAIVYLFLGNLEKAAFVQNLAFGLASIALFYILLRKLSGIKIATIGLILFTLNGHFIFSYLSPTPQTIITFLGIVLFLSLLSKDGKHIFISGLITALMYLARPEYFFLPIPVIIFFWLSGRPGLKIFLRRIIIYLIGFILVASPYLIFLHQTSGTWTFTGRSSATGLYLSNELNVGTEEVQGDNFIEPATKEGQSESLIKSLAQNPGPAAKKIFKGLRDSERNMSRVFGFLGLGFFALGIRRYILDHRFKELAISAVLISPILAIALGQGGTTNYLIQFFFIIILYAAIGIVSLSEDIKSAFNHRSQLVLIVLTIITTFMLFLPVPQNYLFTPRENISKEYKLMGLWLKENLPETRDQILLSRKPETSFYAEARFRLIPKDLSEREISDYMKTNNIRYLVADSRHFKKEYTQLLPMVSDSKSNYFTLIHKIDYLGNIIAIYQLTR